MQGTVVVLTQYNINITCENGYVGHKGSRQGTVVVLRQHNIKNENGYVMHTGVGREPW